MENKKQIIIASSLLLALTSVFLPRPAQAASLYFSPASGSFSVGATFNVTVRTDTQGAAVNTTEANIAYPSESLELVRVTASPTFYLQTPGSPARGNGTAYFGGGLPSPGYTGANGVVGTMTFRAIKEGDATVSISSGKVLLNDGSGTEGLNATAGARYAITTAPTPQPTTGGHGSPVVSSATHPDPGKWYRGKTATLSWSRPEGVYGFSFELDHDPGTVPDNILDTTITTTRTYEDLADGVWYFHIKSRGQSLGSAFGETAHFPIQIDTVAPKPLDIKVPEHDNLQDMPSTFTLYFEHDDPNLDYYELYLDGVLIATIPHNPFTFENLAPGHHSIKLVAFDKAGNKTESSLSIAVTQKTPALGLDFFDQTFTLPAYILIILNLVVIILLAVIIWLVVRRRHSGNNLDERINDLQKQIDKSLEKTKKEIGRKLTKLIKQYEGQVSEDDLQAADLIKEGIAEAEEKIDTELSRLSEAKRQTRGSRSKTKDAE
ncbi:MAG: hypothetical protein A3K05_00085 [Candidatus Doudnabacteria bacterium RIFCSPHIGHO2_01_48_18]|uniref:Cohesin domain-containing protein n=1 Tax=Candidatus Doudnabacteria bacterium RIFCSPLOWO2_02_FULL_48_13 TaxID=1817845 RepID=A0A1F5QD62_9BACT|nr:MAG: hypothetical protein A3K05_00085 [Candidatus Doudnabacteria bacterium RIFCSPHIGHO2_01_48_18]OGF00135.1 MAG: hypothetical protein A3J05_03490 [Candidatus Doudnabacteria bacterium RIFCSPLOWO2_02_FULL_48_13]